MTSTFDLALSYTYVGNCLILLYISQEWICVYHEKTGKDSINLLTNRSQSDLRKLTQPAQILKQIKSVGLFQIYFPQLYTLSTKKLASSPTLNHILLSFSHANTKQTKR